MAQTQEHLDGIICRDQSTCTKLAGLSRRRLRLLFLNDSNSLFSYYRSFFLWRLARIFFLRLCFAIFFLRRFRRLGIDIPPFRKIILYALSESASRRFALISVFAGDFGRAGGRIRVVGQGGLRRQGGTHWAGALRRLKGNLLDLSPGKKCLMPFSFGRSRLRCKMFDTGAESYPLIS
jgi:hypothetical protein